MPPRGDAVVTLVHSHCEGGVLRPGVAGREGVVTQYAVRRGVGRGRRVRTHMGRGGGDPGQSQFLWHTKHLAHALGADLE